MELPVHQHGAIPPELPTPKEEGEEEEEEEKSEGKGEIHGRQDNGHYRRPPRSRRGGLYSCQETHIVGSQLTHGPDAVVVGHAADEAICRLSSIGSTQVVEVPELLQGMGEG